jgi:hypothetical protein
MCCTLVTEIDAKTCWRIYVYSWRIHCCALLFIRCTLYREIIRIRVLYLDDICILSYVMFQCSFRWTVYKILSSNLVSCKVGLHWPVYVTIFRPEIFSAFCGGSQGLSWAVEPRKEEFLVQDSNTKVHLNPFNNLKAAISCETSIFHGVENPSHDLLGCDTV